LQIVSDEQNLFFSSRFSRLCVQKEWSLFYFLMPCLCKYQTYVIDSSVITLY
jgi:hypothetical protein